MAFSSVSEWIAAPLRYRRHPTGFPRRPRRRPRRGRAWRSHGGTSVRDEAGVALLSRDDGATAARMWWRWAPNWDPRRSRGSHQADAGDAVLGPAAPGPVPRPGCGKIVRDRAHRSCRPRRDLASERIAGSCPPRGDARRYTAVDGSEMFCQDHPGFLTGPSVRPPWQGRARPP